MTTYVSDPLTKINRPLFGYLDRLADILASDPYGEDMEDIHGRRRASRASK